MHWRLVNHCIHCIHAWRARAWSQMLTVSNFYFSKRRKRKPREKKVSNVTVEHLPFSISHRLAFSTHTLCYTLSLFHSCVDLFLFFFFFLFLLFLIFTTSSHTQLTHWNEWTFDFVMVSLCGSFASHLNEWKHK